MIVDSLNKKVEKSKFIFELDTNEYLLIEVAILNLLLNLKYSENHSDYSNIRDLMIKLRLKFLFVRYFQLYW